MAFTTHTVPPTRLYLQVKFDTLGLEVKKPLSLPSVHVHTHTHRVLKSDSNPSCKQDALPAAFTRACPGQRQNSLKESWNRWWEAAFSWPLKDKEATGSTKKRDLVKNKVYLALHIQTEKRQQCLSDIQGSRWTKKERKTNRKYQIAQACRKANIEKKEKKSTLNVLKCSWIFPISFSPCDRSLMFYWYLIVKSQQLRY